MGVHEKKKGGNITYDDGWSKNMGAYDNGGGAKNKDGGASSRSGLIHFIWNKKWEP